MALNYLNTEIAYVKGVGPLRAEHLAEEQGIRTAYDLLVNYPFRYIDKSTITAIKDVTTEEAVQIKGVLVSKALKRTARSNYLVATIKDSSGFIQLVWFKGVRYIEKYLEPNTEYLVYGKANRFKGALSIAHPEMEKSSISTKLKSSFDPVYSSTERLNNLSFDSKARRKSVQAILSQVEKLGLKETALIERLSFFN